MIKETSHISEKRKDYLTNGVGPLGSNLGGEKKSMLGYYFTSYRRINSRWVKELNIKNIKS